jgi:uncharacterized protein YjbI with pentapeptide repeats
VADESPGSTPVGSDRISTPASAERETTPPSAERVPTPAGADRIATPAGNERTAAADREERAATPTGTGGTVQPVAPSWWSAWGPKLKRLLAFIGVPSLAAAIALWKNICPIIGLCGRLSVEQQIAAAVDADPAVRSQAILDLEPLARDRDDARVVLPALLAFVREERRRAPEHACNASLESIPGDVQAALGMMVLAAQAVPAALRLDTLDLSGASFRQAGIAGATMIGTCLSRAVLDSAQARGARLTRAELPRASLRGAVLDSATFEDARLDSATFRGASLIGVDMSEASALGTTFAFARMPCALLGNAMLGGANFSFADLRWAYFGGARVGNAQNLVEADSLRHATFDGALDLPPAIARTLRARGALMEAVSDLSWYEPRLAQFARDSVCHIPSR